MEIARIDNEFSRWNDLLALIRSSFVYMDPIIDPPSSAHALTPEKLEMKALEEVAFVATDEETLAGCVFCKPEAGGVLYIGKLAVNPAYQGKGIGRTLLACAEETARQTGCSALRLETRIELVGNHAIFARYGFHKTAERCHPGFAHPTFIEMRKPL